MSLDGSFTCTSALDRFLARCPKLQKNRVLQSLAQKGDALTEEEVVNSLPELILHPDYTIPLIGCFAPLVQRIVEKSVSLLRLVPNLTSNSANEDDCVEVGDDEVNVIEFYIRRGRALKLHEIACLAFSRALDLAPFLLRSVLSYFSFAPPPFQYLLAMGSVLMLSAKDIHYLLYTTRISFRFLLIDSEVFSVLWDWSCFLDLVILSTNAGLCDETELLRNILDIRWCGVQVLSIAMKVSDRATSHFGLEPETALTCYNRWAEFSQDVAIEKAGMYLESCGLGMRRSLEGPTNFGQDYSLQSLGHRSVFISSSKPHETHFVRRVCQKSTCDRKSIKCPFVLTSAMKKSFEIVSLAVSQKWPILLHGPSGAGKTALINKLAEVTGHEVLFLHMDEQMDSKALVGSYICTEQPGEFRWQPGSLTQALLNGFWVVFEDIDKAPSEIHSILLSLLEGGSTYMTGHGESINVAEGFRLFATISSSKHDFSHGAGSILLSSLWRKVMVGSPRDEDLIDILNVWYPSLESLSGKLIDTLKEVNSVISSQFGGFQIHTSCSAGVFSRFSLRDLLKWCRRITARDLNFSGRSLLVEDCKSIYQEAVDIFVASTASLDYRAFLMREIAKMWGLPTTEVETLYPPNKPTIQSLPFDLQVGRVTLKCNRAAESFLPQRKVFVELHCSLHILERIACSVKYNEPVLLVGETGTGKTTLVQNLATRLRQPLTVLNLSQQSDVADLLGGFKPTNARFVCIPLYEEFKDLFSKSYSKKVNGRILSEVAKSVSGRKWKELLIQFQAVVKRHKKRTCEWGEYGCGTKRKRPLGEDILQRWESFSATVQTALNQILASMMPFSFVEGAFIAALRNGHWILLDEINLAPPETLQRIVGVLEGEEGTLCLAERGDVGYINRHPNFRIFACMNPATDAGKKDLPYSVKSRFTEYFVDDVLSDDDLTLFVAQYMDGVHHNREIVGRIVNFYKKIKIESQRKLQDGANQKPQFSLRSLSRALGYAKKAKNKFEFDRALYDGFCMFFLTLLDEPSAKLMNGWIVHDLLGGRMPRDVDFRHYVMGKQEPNGVPMNYVLTRSISEQLRNLARAVFIKRYPVLLQGPTSSGKTSLVQYLAAFTGNEFVRINNHEHTDLQEYFGTYVPDSHGNLKFQEGPLVKAVRSGHWVVLDELNLAPSDVLEALNRLLDDNRELFVPELLETVPAHPNFMLFATQNPPTFYGGRKMLSRAFRNRFLEIHVDEIPKDELITILEERCKIPESYAKKMVDVMKDLQLHRQSSKVFAGKHGFMTPRDLFRWADRSRVFGGFYEGLAKDGYYLLADRLRDESEKNVVHEILEKHLRTTLRRDDLYLEKSAGADAVMGLSERLGVIENPGNIIWTTSMLRLYFLIERCHRLREPVLLVGETGGGKTTVCQSLSIAMGSKLHILNCHQHTETSDFLGGFYPLRDRSRLAEEFKYLVEQLKLSKVFVHFPGEAIVSSDIESASSTIDSLNIIINNHTKSILPHLNVTNKEIDDFEHAVQDLVHLQQKWQAIFEWQDGPLVQAMKNGDMFLIDEISLADDSVLERLNSILEPEKKLTLAEKGGPILEEITAHPNFFLLATMNPGGDYGKKELSPALRNRFTEIWVPPVSNLSELRSIAVARLQNSELSCIVDSMLNFWEWFNQLQTGRLLTVRDLLAWVSFINATESTLGINLSFIHGVFLVLLDGLSLGTGVSMLDARNLREKCLTYLVEQLQAGEANIVDLEFSKIDNYGWGRTGENSGKDSHNVHSDHLFGIDPFYILKGDKSGKQGGFEFLAPTTCRNAMRVLRAMQLQKPVLLEGSPGVGKTSLVTAIAEFSGHNVVRINLSEQTDIMDLLGSDLPVESEKGMKFAWSDGILLQALRSGSWVLLDELNLAPQSVLEGLNAILDHRAEVYIPELGLTFKCPPSFRVFACQNPSSQGCGRKGLPKSFLNRFIKVYVDELVEDDYLFICSSLYPLIPRSLLSKLIHFNSRLYEDTMVLHKYGQDGSPWEFNLRDVLRSCQMIEGATERSKVDCFLSTVYVQRMRTVTDRREVINLFEEVFEVKPFMNTYPRVKVNPQYLTVGTAFGERNLIQPTKTMKSQLNILPSVGHSLEATLHCVQHQWLCILVGPSSSGKTSIVRLLAQLTGNILHEINLSSGTDISELLGCFEQYSAFRHLRTVIGQIEGYVNEYFGLLSEYSLEALARQRKDLISRWFSFLSTTNYGSSISGFDSMFAEHWTSRSHDLLYLLIEIMEQLKLDVEKYQLPMSWSCTDMNRSMETILKLQENAQTQLFSAKFEWVAGGLIKAIERGEWVLLENANLCNPTILDRINSLVEPAGSITVNECGLVDGKPLVLSAHRKFRLFLTVDPRHGEVSRAMRNRGVEVYMMPPHWGLEGSDSKEAEDIELKRFLVISGIPVSGLVNSMVQAHLYARERGSVLGVNITLRELTYWVQLFQQLLQTGSRPVWALHLSWEHIYLSSLGEGEGREIVDHAKSTFLSHQSEKIQILSNFQSLGLDSLLGCSLSLPGGWPTPLKLRNFVWFSREACIRQNCQYLEYLGAQCAAYNVSGGNNKHYGVHKLLPSIIPVHMLHHLLYPSSNHQSFEEAQRTTSGMELLNKMLLFAANWTIEQATEGDVQMYISWLKWYSSKLEPYCSFFKYFLTILEQERDHLIWKCLINCWREITSSLQINVEMHPIPLLSMELVELAASNDDLETPKRLLYNAIQSIGLLQLSFCQWWMEDNYVGSGIYPFLILPMLKQLRRLEVDILNAIVGSACFNLLSQFYAQLIEHHNLLWNNYTSSQKDRVVISWRWLKKDVVKLRDICPDAVESFLVEVRELEKESFCSFNSPKSMLWVYSGHPIMPSSASAYFKMQQLLGFCDSVWPTVMRSQKQISNEIDGRINITLSRNTELKYLAMQGVCMSSYITSKGGEEDADIIHQLEDIYRMLLERFEREKHCLEGVMVGKTRIPEENSIPTCCDFGLEVLCSNAGLDSWLEILPLLDNKSFALDIHLLYELSEGIPVDPEEPYPALSSVIELLKYALDFSLNFSSRPPTDFLSHQKILWILDAWPSSESVSTKVSCFVHEMWFKWHSSLWLQTQRQSKIFLQHERNHSGVPCFLFQPLITTTLDQILCSQSTPIKDYPVNCLKVRVASGNLWQDAPLRRNLPNILLSLGQSLFQQIIFAHKKSFEHSKFKKIKSIFRSIKKNSITPEKLHILQLLIESSSHSGLTSLVKSCVEPLLKELYYVSSSQDFLYNLGNAWLHIANLRIHLLLQHEDPDPALKYALKYSNLVEKICMLELEIKVRDECDNLAGRNLARDDQRERRCTLENLKMEQKRLQKKLVFRPDPAKYEKLRYECIDFLTMVKSSFTLAKTIKCGEKDLQLLIDEACNWQETSTCFINGLSEEYASYNDLIQPVQIAVCEMKLGLSLVVSSALQKAFLCQAEEENVDKILDTIYSFVQFPRCIASGPISVDLDTMLPEWRTSDVDVSEHVLAVDINLLNKLVSVPHSSRPDKVVSGLQLQASIHQNILDRISHHLYTSSLMDKPSFLLLSTIFEQFARLWVTMKSQIRTKQDDESQQFKFKSRVFKIEDILKVDVSSLRKLASDGSLPSEWQEILAEEDSAEVVPAKEDENLEEEWKLIEESVLKGIVHVHNQLFGSNNLVDHPGVFQVTDEDRLRSFMDSYEVSKTIIKDLPVLLSSSVDANVMPEHLLCLCIEYSKKFGSSNHVNHVYNFYKDPNSLILSKMVKPLTILQDRLLSMLKDSPEHPDLQKISNILELLLALPLDSPLAKALLGLQFLVSRVQSLQENGSKFSLSDQLQPILLLISSWQRLETECWPALLDGVLQQYEINATKLWFPLYSVLHRKSSGETDSNCISTIQSLEDFVQTASIGEFKKRLELLVAFHGEFNTSKLLELSLSPQLMANLKILYNVLGYYIQFLPLISERIEAIRKSSEKDLKELSKLSRWEVTNCYSKSTRQKLWKLVQKFNDVLQQPVMSVLNLEEMQKRIIEVPTLLEAKVLDDAHDKVEMPASAIDLSQFGGADRSLHFDAWRKKIDSLSQDIFQGLVKFDFFKGKVAKNIVQSLSSISVCEIYVGGWRDKRGSLKMICETASQCAYLWKHGTKNLRKRMALADLLKTLERSGLSRHISRISEVDLGPNQLSSCFLEPSYEVCHLLMSGSSSFGDVNVNISSHIKKIPLENFDRIWATTNQYYYKNISMLQLIQQIRLNFHKDLTLEQVNRSTSFLNHLVRIQQEQRAVAYGFSEQLKRLRKQVFSLKKFGTINSKKCSIIPEQHTTHICMWQQKRLFDSLSNTSIEASLLLRMVKNTHLDACKNVEAEANNILLLIEKFLPKLQNSKESLDRCLLGNSGIIITPVACRPFIVSEDMKQLVVENFQVISDFEEDLQSLEQQTSQRRCVQEHLLSRFRSLIDKGKCMKEVFHSEDASTVLPFINIHSSFIATSEDAVKHIMSALEKIGLLSNCRSEVSLAKNITSWKGLFVSCIEGLQMDLIFDLVERTIIFAGKFANRSGSTQPDLCLSVEVLLKDLHVLLDLILTFGESLLIELVAMHKIVAEMTHMLANVFAALYLRGFGASESDQVDDADGDKTKEASGTGMGEGEGLNDVSNQIEDEEQLLGTSEKPSEGTDDSNEVPNKKDKGIEMEEDFAGDTFSVSEDSGDDEGQEEGEDVNPESVMGEGSNDKEIVDEKLWDKEEDGKPDNPTEKFEVGPSVRETEMNSKELRAKDETEPYEDESGILNNDQSDQVGQDDENADVGSDEDRYDEDMKMDKAEAFEAPSGIEVDEQNQDFKDDMDIAEQEADTIEEAEPDPNEDEGTCDEDRKADQMDDQMDGADSGPLDENNEADGPHNEQENAVTDSLEVGKETIESGSEDPTDDPMLSADSVKPMDVAHATDSIQTPEICWSNISDLQNGLVSSGGLHSNDVTKMELSMPDSSKEGDVTADQPNVRSPPHSSTSMQRARANPFRSIGDALEEWKERIHISSDPVEQKAESHDEVEDKNAEEYRYVTELEEGTSQALGPATSEQIDKNVKGNKFNEPDADHPDQGEDPAQMDIEKESETHEMKKCTNAAVRQKISEKIQDQVGPTNPLTIEEAMEVTGLPVNQSEDLVAVNNSFFTKDEMLQIGKLSMYDQKLEKVADMEITIEDATADWRRYELDTSRLSQELTEQLRLVMEPTLANKLQGDYKTGKRINMKKVIPYIASHFRKDKIWLRRTRPNKRDYQVVVAIDDSRSMSESGCGEFARKALVTVCRAMSQLEVGQLAVASFGEKGKVRLLHDFHHPFTTEVGVKMVRSLEFKQENRIADAPIADLLKYLNSKLDASVASARLPSGQNPLQQLILIIGDGLLHEQSENVKAYVTEALSRNRMVAFIVLDSSIVDLQVFSLGSSLLGTSLSATKYLDSFPFPFYIVLKNIEALPRTLADLLRQWFELMQTARD